MDTQEYMKSMIAEVTLTVNNETVFTIVNCEKCGDFHQKDECEMHTIKKSLKLNPKPYLNLFGTFDFSKVLE